jgi:hypothetical protein
MLAPFNRAQAYILTSNGFGQADRNSLFRGSPGKSLRIYCRKAPHRQREFSLNATNVTAPLVGVKDVSDNAQIVPIAEVD